jgi:hypothetical protein
MEFTGNRPMRTRFIKPGFFQNPELVELPFETRLLFAGLPCCADREGRLEDRPTKVKMQLFPGDLVNVKVMFDQLEDANLIQRYTTAEGQKCIQIVNFLKHQRPHPRELPSEIPCYDPGVPQVEPGSCPESPSLFHSFTLSPVSNSKGHRPADDRFPEWWVHYPKKVKKKPAREIWKRRGLDSRADELIADIRNRLANDARFKRYTPDPTTYLNQERWNDELTTEIDNERITETPSDRHRKALARRGRPGDDPTVVENA